jgi:WD40 repeat protein
MLFRMTALTALWLCLNTHKVRCARYSTDGSSFATGSEDGTVRIWRRVAEAEEDG